MLWDDAEVVQKCLLGDSEAIQQLVLHYQQDVLGLCVRMLQHRQDAEDVTQEVFLRIFRSLHRWDSSRPLKPWIVGIAVNRCRTWLSQRAKRPELIDYLESAASAPLADDSQELIREINRATQFLRPDYRAVFVLFHQQGQPYEEIAQAMDRPVGTIKTWLHRARLEVLHQLQQRGMVPVEEPENSEGSEAQASMR